jgi:hypothetical protein
MIQNSGVNRLGFACTQHSKEIAAEIGCFILEHIKSSSCIPHSQLAVELRNDLVINNSLYKNLYLWDRNVASYENNILALFFSRLSGKINKNIFISRDYKIMIICMIIINIILVSSVLSSSLEISDFRYFINNFGLISLTTIIAFGIFLFIGYGKIDYNLAIIIFVIYLLSKVLFSKINLEYLLLWRIASFLLSFLILSIIASNFYKKFLKTIILIDLRFLADYRLMASALIVFMLKSFFATSGPGVALLAMYYIHYLVCIIYALLTN